MFQVFIHTHFWDLHSLYCYSHSLTLSLSAIWCGKLRIRFLWRVNNIVAQLSALV